METWKKLGELKSKYANLVLSIHTVISQFNVKRFPEIYKGLQSLAPDSDITEVRKNVSSLSVAWLTPLPRDYAADWPIC